GSAVPCPSHAATPLTEGDRPDALALAPPCAGASVAYWGAARFLFQEGLRCPALASRFKSGHRSYALCRESHSSVVCPYDPLPGTRSAVAFPGEQACKRPSRVVAANCGDCLPYLWGSRRGRLKI